MCPSIPPKAMNYLKHLPTIASWIQTDKQITGTDLFVFKTIFPEPYRLLKNATYEQIRETISPFQDDARFGSYVRLALSPQGENWLRYALDIIHRS